MDENKKHEYRYSDIIIEKVGDVSLIKKPYYYRDGIGRNLIPKVKNENFLRGAALSNIKIINPDKSIVFEMTITVPFIIYANSWIEVDVSLICSFLLRASNYMQGILTYYLKENDKFIRIPPEINVSKLYDSIKIELQQLSN